jgi:hypothetical protein
MRTIKHTSRIEDKTKSNWFRHVSLGVCTSAWAPMAQGRGVGRVSSIRDGMGDVEPDRWFSFLGLEMEE